MNTRLLLMLALACAGAARLGAQRTTPTTITYQGRLTAGDKPASGKYDLQFRLLDALTGGAALDTIDLSQVPVSNSVFTVQLDFAAANPNFDVFNGDPRYLEIRTRPSVQNPGPFTVLTPRQPITSAPYAFFSYKAREAALSDSAKTAAVLLGSVTDSQLPAGLARLSGNQSFSGVNTFSGAVGIGGPPQDAALDVEGNMHLNDFTLFLRPGADHNHGLGWFGAGKPFGGVSTDGPVLYGLSGGALGVLGNGERAVLSWNSDGRVGINTSAPQTALHVEDIDATLTLKNRKDVVGTFVGDSFSALQLGLYNPTRQDLPRIPALSSRTFFAMSADGRVGSTVNAFIGDPVYRNLLDDGNGHLGVTGMIRTMAPGQSMILSVSPSAGLSVAALRIIPALTTRLGNAPSFLAGDEANSIGGNIAGSAVLSGGSAKLPNIVNSSLSVIVGGTGNKIDGEADGGSIGGGFNNHIVAGASLATIAGGQQNTIEKSGASGMIPGGLGNVVNGFGAFAAGYNAQAFHNGAFVWSHDYILKNVHLPFPSTQANEFSVRCTGGARFVSGYAVDGKLITFGVVLNPNSGSWSTLSDRNAKTNFNPVNPRDVLAKVAALPIQAWRYKGEPGSIRHIGPVAQDFHAAFGLGRSEKTIDTVDADGVALVAIQGLNQKVEDQAAEIRELRNLVGQLARQVEGRAHRE